jgi:hypothetical protein
MHNINRICAEPKMITSANKYLSKKIPAIDLTLPTKMNCCHIKLKHIAIRTPIKFDIVLFINLSNKALRAVAIIDVIPPAIIDNKPTLTFFCIYIFIIIYIYIYIMSKARIMGAGLAGATRKGDGANVNQVQFGNKLQGLPPTTGKSTNFNLRAIKNRAWGNKRNVIFCMNQLGGVGGVRGSRMFLPSADGVGKCVPGEYLGPGTEPEPEPSITYTEDNSLGGHTGVITVIGTHEVSLTDILTLNGWTDALNLKIIGGSGSGHIWKDFIFDYDVLVLGYPNKLHIENISLVTTTIDDYAVYSRDTLTTMKNVIISGYSASGTAGGAMRIRSADYSSLNHSASSPTLYNVTVTNCCRGIRIQDSIEAYVKDCNVINVTDNAIYFAGGSYTSADGCTNCTADNCNVIEAGNVAFMNIGGSNNKFINSSMNGSRGAAVGVYNTNGTIEVDNCIFTHANRGLPLTPWGGATDGFGGAACGLAVNVLDISGILNVHDSTFNSGAGSVYWKTLPGTMTVLANDVTELNFPDGLVGTGSSPIIGAP